MLDRLIITMAQPNPFSMGGGLPETMPDTSAQHGSTERGTRRSYFDTMGGDTPVQTPRNMSPRRSPRSRARSAGPQYAQEEEDYEARREERQQDRREARQGDAVGTAFRLNACEQSLRSHNDELAAQRLMIKQLTDAVEKMVAEKVVTDNKLNAVVDLVDQRFGEARDASNEIQRTSVQRVEVLTATMQSIANEISQKFVDISKDIDMLKRNSRSSTDTPSAPPPPSSWGAEPATPVKPPVAEVPPSPKPETSAPQFGASSNHGQGAYPTAGPPVSHGPPGGNFSNGSTFRPQPTEHTSQPTAAPPPQSSKTFGSGIPHFHMNSPGSPLTGNGNHWAPGAGTELRPFDPRDWSVDGKKPSKELRTFNGDMATYDNWRRRVRDHFVSTNINYSKIFETIERERSPIRWSQLSTTKIDSLPMINWEWIATHLWTFTGGYLEDGILSQRITMCSGEEFNGLELWRVIHQQNSGGSAQLENLEREYFVAFPKCERTSDLQNHLSQWVQLKNKFGIGLPVDHLIAMLWKILPDDVREDLKRQKNLRGNLDQQVAYLYGEIGDSMDEKLSKWNLAKLQQQLKVRSKNSTGINVIGAQHHDEDVPQSAPAVPPPPMPDMSAFEANVERMINAAVARGRGNDRNDRRTDRRQRSGSAGSQRSGRKIPSPKFAGCWCCGKEGHSRANCPEFIAIKKANNGKIPADYEGAYEKAMKKNKVLSPIIAAEHEETQVPFWPLLKSHVKPIPVHNQFHVFDSEDEETDDEESIVRSLHALTPNVQLASDKNKSQRSKRNHHRPLDKSYLQLIAKKVKSGEISLPDIDLDDNEDYEYIWALVDSGAGANVARKDHFSDFTPVDAPKISLTIANGETMKNNGAGEVTCYSRDGFSSKRRFYEAPVDMPILAVSELSQEGELGSEVKFRAKDGVMIDNLTGRRTSFVKRKGVYFMRLYIRKNKVGFGRPDQ